MLWLEPVLEGSLTGPATLPKLATELELVPALKKRIAGFFALNNNMQYLLAGVSGTWWNPMDIPVSNLYHKSILDRLCTTLFPVVPALN